MTDYSNIHIETTLPKPWEQETTFNDVLYDWMGRAPWLAISAAAHLLMYFILTAIPWDQFSNQKAKTLTATLQQTPEEVFEEPEEEIEEVEEEPQEEPQLKDAEIDDHNEEDTNEEFESTEGDPNFLSDSPFDSDAFNDVIGIGGGAGGKFGGRFGGKKNLRAAGGSAVEQALKDALEWLKMHQSEDGSWDCEGFSANCGKIAPGTPCEGGGNAPHDVGVTGLALLAFLGDGNTTNQGEYKDVVSRGIAWLKEQQDPDNGVIGSMSSHDWIYDHAIATLALCEAYYFSKSPLIKKTAQDAINLIFRARNPYGAWRYDYPPIGDSDISVTGWMIFALASAKDAGLEGDFNTAFEFAQNFIDEVTDPASGRVGYSTFGELSSRTPANEHFKREAGEAMTAVGLLCRVFLGQKPEEVPIMKKHAELISSKPPVWDPDGFTSDFYYWYYATYALFQIGPPYWKKWESAMKEAVVGSQSQQGDEKGSWDPSVCAWGYSGGRVYATATMTLCLEVYFRYAQVLGAR